MPEPGVVETTSAPVRSRIGFWLPISVTVLGFVLMGLVFLPQLGFEYDEVMFVPLIFHPERSLFAARIFHHAVPLMQMSYIGALKIWLYWPLLKLMNPGAYAVRLPMLLLAALTILILAETIRRRASVRVAIFTAALTATDISFLFTSTFDWGPVVVQNFLLAAALYCILLRRKTLPGISLAAFVLGLGLWDKAIFLWIFIGLCVSGLMFGWNSLWRELSVRKVFAAAIAFSVAVSPLIIYNVKRQNQTLGNNAHFTFAEIRPKFAFVQIALNGQAFHEFFADQAAPIRAKTASGHSPTVFSPNPSNWRFLAFSCLLVAGMACARPEKRRLILWLFVAVLLAWLQSALTKGAGVFVHHVVIFYPALFVAVGLAAEEIAVKLRGRGTASLAFTGVLLCAAGLNTMRVQLQNLRHFSPTTFWTNADLPLARYLAAHSSQHIVVADWGIATQIDTRTSGTHDAEEISFALKDGTCTGEQVRQWAQSHSLIVLHMANHEMFLGQRAKLAQLAKANGLAVAPVTTVADNAGYPVFEIDTLALPRELNRQIFRKIFRRYIQSNISQ